MKNFKHAVTVGTMLMLFAVIGSGCGNSREKELNAREESLRAREADLDKRIQEFIKRCEEEGAEIKRLNERIQALSDEKTDLALQKANVEKTNSGLKIAIPLTGLVTLVGGIAIGLKAKKDYAWKQNRGEN